MILVDTSVWIEVFRKTRPVDLEAIVAFKDAVTLPNRRLPAAVAFVIRSSAAVLEPHAGPRPIAVTRVRAQPCKPWSRL